MRMVVRQELFRAKIQICEMAHNFKVISNMSYRTSQEVFLMLKTSLLMSSRSSFVISSNLIKFKCCIWSYVKPAGGTSSSFRTTSKKNNDNKSSQILGYTIFTNKEDSSKIESVMSLLVSWSRLNTHCLVFEPSVTVGNYIHLGSYVLYYSYITVKV